MITIPVKLLIVFRTLENTENPYPSQGHRCACDKGPQRPDLLQEHQPGFGLREHVALLSRPRPSAIHHPATHFQLASRCTQQLVHPDHVPRQTQGKRPIHIQPDMLATATDSLDPTTDKLETGLNLSGATHGRVLRSEERRVGKEWRSGWSPAL